MSIKQVIDQLLVEDSTPSRTKQIAKEILDNLEWSEGDEASDSIRAKMSAIHVLAVELLAVRS